MWATFPPCICPVCQMRLTMAEASDGSDAKPRPGDYNVCVRCMSVLVFTETFDLRVADLTEVPADQQANLAKVVAKLRMLKRMYRLGQEEPVS